MASLHPWLVNINGWESPQWLPFNLIYLEFIEFAGHAQSTQSNVAPDLVVPV